VNGFNDDEEQFAPVRELSKPQRRVLGVLIEKAYTVPESYPLTVKSLVTGCNQKSNRAPVTNYSEDQVVQAVEELRPLGLVAVVHTESGRTERYRHYARKRFPFTEPQLAIITELLLRGRQQLGELRARAGRMVPIESLADLKQEIEGLLENGYVQVDGPLDRRGVEIDHNFHLPSENARLVPQTGSSSGAPATTYESGEEESRPATPRSFSPAEEQKWEAAHQALQQEVAELRQTVGELQDNLAELRRSLGA
jgi:uncharacterized protein YceH (UPF0502 family)